MTEDLDMNIDHVMYVTEHMMNYLIGKEENILLKPNLVRSAKRERAVVTDPEVMDALITILQENGYENISCGDSLSLIHI